MLNVNSYNQLKQNLHVLITPMCLSVSTLSLFGYRIGDTGEAGGLL